MNDYRSRWEKLELILREKLDISLPRAMRDNAIDMWIHVVKLGLPDPLHLDLVCHLQHPLEGYCPRSHQNNS